MNNDRRKAITAQIARTEKLKERLDAWKAELDEIKAEAEELKSEIESSKDEEEEYKDNMPESLQSSERYYTAEAAVEQLEAALEKLGEVEDLTPTISYVTAVLYAETEGRSGKPTEERKRLEAEVTAEDYTEAEKVREWAMAGGAGSGDYAHNLAILCAMDEVEPKRGGFVASAVAAKARADEQELRRTRERQEAAKSSWLGAVGERLKDLPVTFESSRTVGGGYYGNTYLMKFRDASGNILTWFSSNCFSLRPGEEVKITGTVKAHNEYNGGRETVLTRCKLEEKVQ